MVMFSIIQFVANGWRAVLWWRFVLLAHLLLLRAGRRHRVRVHALDRVRSRQGDGLSRARADAVRWSSCCRRALRPNIEWRGVPFVTGVLTTFMQLFSGVGGLFLDIFFQKSMLDRKTTVATKAVTQTLQPRPARRLFRLVRRASRDAVPLWTYAPAIVLAIAGTSLAPLVLERMTDHGFRQWTRAIIFAHQHDLSGARGRCSGTG